MSYMIFSHDLDAPSQICFNSDVIFGRISTRILKHSKAVVFCIPHEPEIQGASWFKLRHTHPLGKSRFQLGCVTTQFREKGKQTFVGRDLTCVGPPFMMHLGR
jgi:hypothetical protein